MDALAWCSSLVGTPYVWWMPGDSLLGNCGPFWWSEEARPSLSQIRHEGCNCAGLLNLLARRAGLKPMGTTVEWFEALDGKELRTSDEFATGTLLLRPYTSPEDQGHVAVVLEGGRLLHCYPSSALMKRGFDGPGVTIDETWRTSDCWLSEHGGYYTHICRPAAWVKDRL
jgi:cell wall-associated NlpC family hydrolase